MQQTGNWAWLSDLPYCKQTVAEQCNPCARHRWAIEEGILVEKQQGYNYEPCYAEQWNAMRGYHYLMRIGHLLNVLASSLSTLVALVKEKGPEGFIEWVRETLGGRWLQPADLGARLSALFQRRLLFSPAESYSGP